MIKSTIICALLVVTSSFSFGQTPEQLAQYAKGDSLSYFQFKKALDVLNPLIESLNDNNNGEAILKTKALQRKGHCLEQENQIDKALIIFLDIIDQPESEALITTKYLALISVALIHEKNDALNTCLTYLNKAENLLQRHQLNKQYALFYVRKSSYLRLINQPDSAKLYASMALENATEYNNKLQEADAHLLLGGLEPSEEERINHFSLAAKCFLENGNYLFAAYMYTNISRVYIDASNLSKALVYSDSVIYLAQKQEGLINAFPYEDRALLFEKLNNKDSALFYYKRYISQQFLEWENLKDADIIRIQAVNDSENKEEEIQNQKNINTKQEQLVTLWVALFLIATFTFIILFVLYRKVKTKNKIITNQSEELQRTIFQKEVLLAEVQHRVKNNLQLIIGLLEIQKEKIERVSTDELIIESQNRIKSMAFLHQKLNFFSAEEYVDFDSYLQEITSLLKNSFDGLNKDVEFILNSKSKHISMDEAIPLGLILVELINNSMKFAFINKKDGIIEIDIHDTPNHNKKRILTYQDNGVGFNKEEKINKGTGLEIIDGLVSQLHGNTQFFMEDGHKIEIRF